MPRGRPIGSAIRQNMVEILYFLGRGTGYDIFKVYKQVYPAVTLRVMYYHLKKGVSLKEFKVAEVKQVSGDYSWGSSAEKIYYTLDVMAKPTMDRKVKAYLDSQKTK
ncbi:hypothetical protein JW868_00930 [Candidatus Woesearchaeota archaeon]|nr:hypothetical protein [Candidatus Woesearchaeota archaeon]